MALHPLAMQLPVASGLKASKGIEILTWGTPNGAKATIMAEELKAAYGTDYTVQAIHLPKAIQKQPWYLELNPNGKIPTLMDHDLGFSIGESGAILQHLVRHHDPEHKFSFTEPIYLAKQDQWLNFMQGDLTPNAVQHVRFYRFLRKREYLAMSLFHREGIRILETLDMALDGRHYLVGPGKGKYSVADIGNFPFVNNSFLTGLGSLKPYPNLYAWWERIWARQTVKDGTNTPYPAVGVNELMERKLQEDPEFAAAEAKLKSELQKALDENPPFTGPPVLK